MEWLSENWVWVLIAVAFVAMHMFGHGGHGGHEEHGGRREGARIPRKAGESGERGDEDASVGHRH